MHILNDMTPPPTHTPPFTVTVGVLHFVKTDGTTFPQHCSSYATGVAAIAALDLINWFNFCSLQKHIGRSHLSITAIDLMVTGAGKAAVLQTCFEGLKATTSFEECLLWRLRPEKEEGWLEAMEGDTSLVMERETQEETFTLSFRSEDCPLHWRAWKGKALVNAKYGQSDVAELNKGVDKLLGTTSINTIILAVTNEEEHCLGLLQLVNKIDVSGTQQEFGNEDEASVETIVSTIALVIDYFEAHYEVDRIERFIENERAKEREISQGIERTKEETERLSK